MATEGNDLWDEDDDNLGGAGDGSGDGTGDGSGDGTGGDGSGSGDGDGSGAGDGAGSGDGDGAGAGDGIEAPGIEQYLAQHGITGGLIPFENEEGGEPVLRHYNDLTPEEQFNVLSSLAEKGSPDIAAKYDLDPNEIGLLNYVRTYAKDNPGSTANDAIEALAQQRLGQILALQQASSVDYTSMTDDAVMTKWLKDTNPDATEADLADELTRLKGSKFFASQAKTIREGFVAAQQAEANEAETLHNAEVEALREEDRRLIATTVAGMEDVAGFTLDNDAKNQVLSKILETNEHGDSKFMEEVFSDPGRLFKAAWLYYNVENYLDEMVKNHKRALATEFQRGKQFAATGFPGEPLNGVGGAPAGGGEGGDDNLGRRTQNSTLEELWDNEA